MKERMHRLTSRPARLGASDAASGCYLNPYKERKQRRLYDTGALREVRNEMRTRGHR